MQGLISSWNDMKEIINDEMGGDAAGIGSWHISSGGPRKNNEYPVKVCPVNVCISNTGQS
jgi:hypothetical protein